MLGSQSVCKFRPNFLYALSGPGRKPMGLLQFIDYIKQKMGYKKCLVFCGEKKPQILSLTDANIDTFPCYASNDEKNIDVSKIKSEGKLIILLYTYQSIRVLAKTLIL